MGIVGSWLKVAHSSLRHEVNASAWFYSGLRSDIHGSDQSGLFDRMYIIGCRSYFLNRCFSAFRGSFF
ncbi:hypothetical protein HanIR_Chr01g0043051 [Helianthus annuus]|nr:hypothetical protein HanIR_Chr01g0043051 [Helianthus annuus]